MVKLTNNHSKSELRKHYLSLRNAQNRLISYFASRKISKRLSRLTIIKNSKVIALYVALEKEVNLKHFLKWALANGKIVLLPRVENKTLVFHQINSLNYPFKIWKGLRVPHQDLVTYQLANIETILIPGVAFDRQGNRIGFGGGFYDRYLENHQNTNLIGVAFATQITPTTIACEKHDITMDYLITEIEFIKGGSQ